MCNIFSGHISFGEEDWGKVYFGPTYVHHEIDRESIPHEHLLAWETVEKADFRSFRFTHDCGGNVPEKTKETLMELLEEWGKEQEEHVHEYLEHIAMEDEDQDARYTATKHITSQETLRKIATGDKYRYRWARIVAVGRITDQETLKHIAAKSQDADVREAAIEHITDQDMLKHVALEDNSWRIRAKATKSITDQETLRQIAKEDENWYVRVTAIKRILNQETLNRIAIEDKNEWVQKAATMRLAKLNQK